MVSIASVEASAVPHDDGRGDRITRARQVVSDEVADQFLRGMFWTDPLVDQVVADFAALDRGRGWRLLDQALDAKTASVPGAPESLTALLDPVMRPPSWLDPEQVRWGAAVWWRSEAAVVVGMTAAQRLSYGWGDLNKPQAMNGRSTKMAARRYEETSRWVLAATEPGAIVPGGAGFNGTLKVRLVHAMVRRRLRRNTAWNTVAWGQPIHGTGMAITNNAFLALPIAIAQVLGVRFTDAELEAIRALWHWIGYLMGVPDELLPTDLDKPVEFNIAAMNIFAPPDDDTVALDRALMRSGVRIERVFPARLRPLLAPVLRPVASQLLWGASSAILGQYLEHPDDPARVHHPVISLLRPVTAVSERLRRAGRLGTDFDIASRQRGRLEKGLALIKAAPHALHPQQAERADA